MPDRTIYLTPPHTRGVIRLYNKRTSSVSNANQSARQDSHKVGMLGFMHTQLCIQCKYLAYAL